MSLHRRAARRDTSEPEIMAALKAAGFSVTQLSGENIPDLLVGAMGFDATVECKTGRKKLKPGQTAFHDQWLGRKPVVLRTASEARAWASTTREEWADLLKAREGR